MKIIARKTESTLFLGVYDGHESMKATFVQRGYKNSDGQYLKEYPLPIPFAEKIMENYSKHAESMFADEASPAIRWEDGLQCFASIAKDAGIEWWTSGYILLALRGCPVEINDLDFYFHLRDLDRVYDAFSDYIIEPIAKTTDTWREGSFRYCGLAYAHCPICLFVDPLGTYDDPEPTHFGAYASEHLESIAWKGHTIHVPPIALYIRTLERWGKTEKARQIMEWIE